MTRALALTFVGLLAADVDFSKPPAQVEGYNKVRITCETEARPEGRVFRVSGKAYYPDGVTFVISLRYWKHTQPFVRTRAEVRDRAFSAEVGPFAKAIPGGEVVAEAWFVLNQQTRAVQKRLIDEKYMSCSPPCHWDKRNATRVNVALGGGTAQQQDEKLEKEHLGRGLDAITQALRACEQVCLAVRQEKGTKEQAAAALTQLQGDLTAATEQMASWRNGRQFLLFAGRCVEVDSLASKALETGRLHAAVAGVALEGLPVGGGAFAELARTLRDLRQETEGLRGFLAEEGSLDREWQKLNDAAKSKWDESQGAPAEATTTTPPAKPAGR